MDQEIKITQAESVATIIPPPPPNRPELFVPVRWIVAPECRDGGVWHFGSAHRSVDDLKATEAITNPCETFEIIRIPAQEVAL